jgi:hypothetical protein
MGVSASATTCRDPNGTPSTNVGTITPIVGDSSSVMAARDAGRRGEPRDIHHGRQHHRSSPKIVMSIMFSRLPSGCSKCARLAARSVPNKAYQAKPARGGLARGSLFATTVPGPNDVAAAKPQNTPGSFDGAHRKEPSPTSSATPPNAMTIAVMQRKVSRTQRTGQASGEA